ncbi:Cell shape-determining protein MreC [Candidatus Erwinia haradaeae]|uniref:Cell shape-determining protein MreC n=1 Tax=Candidatus Erwinia haradaeae TaxID=1922217 RepID=A0A451CZA8_9GAMM|nr:rod shape-determining protein MreC [Candidatus Erwinia haradaeae]VFP78689.1 Cell shape-determining protein MreC [Candidatus Erwinia haradaeae]
MKPMFSKTSSLHLNLLIAIILSTIMMIADNRFHTFSSIHSYMNTVVNSLYLLINVPRQMLDYLSQIFTSHHALDLKNKALQNQLMCKNSELLILNHMKKENAHLRALLGSPLREDEHKIITQVISSSANPYMHQVIIDKGRIDNVYEGQPVISDQGVVGQIVSVSKNTSRVLLICDASHALPIQVLRNDLRAIVSGNGCSKELQLEYYPDHTDMRCGDMLVTSGLGGRFPEGYPVAIVSSIKEDNHHGYSIIQARPVADLQHLRYLLLLWVGNRYKSHPPMPNEVHHMAEERQKKKMTMPLLSKTKNITENQVIPRHSNHSKTTEGIQETNM